MLRYLVEDGETPGIVLGMLEADGTRRVLTYGSSGPDARPLGPLSVFEIGSISKVFTGTLLAEMVARNEVALDDPVSTHLPPEVTVPSRNGREITLLDLATHTSGLPRLPDDFPSWSPDGEDPFAEYTVENLYAFLSSHELRRDPGGEVEYSNLGAGLLGHVLSRAARTPLPSLLHERVMEPLGMRMTGYALDGDIGAWMTKGHRDGSVVSFITASEAFEGSVGLRSNVEDLLTFLEANIGQAPIELEKAMETAREVHVLGRSLAWQSFAPTGRPILLHGGSTRGFSTSIAFDPETRQGIVVLTNSTGRALGGNLALELLLYDSESAVPEVPVAPSALAALVGEYEVAPGRSIHVRLEEGGHLTFQQTGLVRTPLYAVSDTSFAQKRLGLTFTFQRGGAGDAVNLLLRGKMGEELTELNARRVKDGSPPPGVVAGNAGSAVTFNRIQNRIYSAVRQWGAGFWIPMGLVGVFGLAVLARRIGRRRSEKVRP